MHIEDYGPRGLAAVYAAVSGGRVEQHIGDDGIPVTRMRPDVSDDVQKEHDATTEGILARREREGTILPTQATALAEIRARRSALRGEHKVKLELEGRGTFAAAPHSEPERKAAIAALALPGCEALAAELQADASVTPAAAALQIAAKYKELKARANVVDLDLHRHAADAPSRSAETIAAPKNLHAVRTQAVLDWEASAELQREFKTAAEYSNYQVGVATGRVRIFHGPGSAA